jgi:hypothetical protein
MLYLTLLMGVCLLFTLFNRFNIPNYMVYKNILYDDIRSLMKAAGQNMLGSLTNNMLFCSVHRWYFYIITYFTHTPQTKNST